MVRAAYRGRPRILPLSSITWIPGPQLTPGQRELVLSRCTGRSTVERAGYLWRTFGFRPGRLETDEEWVAWREFPFTPDGDVWDARPRDIPKPPDTRPDAPFRIRTVSPTSTPDVFVIDTYGGVSGFVHAVAFGAGAPTPGDSIDRFSTWESAEAAAWAGLAIPNTVMVSVSDWASLGAPDAERYRAYLHACFRPSPSGIVEWLSGPAMSYPATGATRWQAVACCVEVARGDARYAGLTWRSVGCEDARMGGEPI